MGDAAAQAPTGVDFWSIVIAGFMKLADDIRENRAPPAPSATPGQLAGALEQLHANLPAIIGTLRAHQGVVTGAADLLAALSKAGVPHAADIEAAVLAAPGALATIDKWLPWILPFFSGPAGGAASPGPLITEADWSGWKGPQPVNNPSGAIGGGQ